MLLRELFVKCALLCLVMSFSSFTFADNGYWIQPNPEQPSSLDRPVGSSAVMSGKICAMKRIDNMTLQCGAIKDKNVQVFATFPDEMQDVSEQILIQKNANDWSYQFTTPALAADGNNTLTIVVGKFDKETRALLRTKARLQNTLVRIEQNIQALDPSKRNYQNRLAHFQSRKTLIQEVIASIEENIDRNPDVLARYSRPLMVGGVVNGQHSHASSFNHYKLSVSSDKGAYLAGESAQISGSVMLTKETKHTNGMNGRIELKLNNAIVANETGVQLALDIPRSISATAPNLISQLNPVELSFYNAREKIRVALPFELLVSNGTQNPMPIARIAANKTEALTGEAIQFNAQGSTAGVGAIIDYTIDFGDGTISSGTNSSWSHSYASQGIYTARVTVTDSELNKSSATTQVSVTEPVSTSGPLANFTYKVEPETGELVTFFQGRPGDAAIVSARYTTSDGQSADVAEIIWRRYSIFNLNPNMSVTLTVTDANGKTDSKTHTIIQESTPVVHLYWKDLGSRKAFFDFRDSFDTIDEIAGFEIDYGDGTITNFEFVDKLALHTYSAAGTYTVRLTAANYDDVEVSRTFQVTVTDLILPLAAPIASYEIGFPQNSNNVTFYLNQSIALSGSIVSVRWDYGDGTSYFGNDAIHAHYYDPGAYLATLTITDSNGSVSSQTQRIIIEDAGAPFIAGFFCNDTGGTGQISCESYVYDRDKDISEISVAWGDGTTQNIPVTNPEWMFILETNHTYQFAGTYNYTMTVKTNRGEEVSYSGSATVSGEVPNQAPVASVNCYSNFLNVVCDSGFSFDPDGYIAQYEWDMGDSTQYQGSHFVSHNFAENGTYSVTLKVTDNLGASSSYSVLVNATRQSAPPALTAQCTSSERFKVNCTAQAQADLGEIVAISWSMPDGVEIQGETITHEFTEGGNKYISATALDSNSLSSSVVIQVEVLAEDPIPVAGFNCDDSVPLKLNCTGFSSRTTYGTIVSYQWLVNGEPRADRMNEIFDFADAQSVSLSLTVVNSFGREDTIEKSYTVKSLQESGIAAGEITLSGYPQDGFKNVNSELNFIVTGVQPSRVLNDETGEVESNFRLSINDTTQRDEEIELEGNSLKLISSLEDGLNIILLEVYDTQGNVLAKTFELYAGSRTLTVDVASASASAGAKKIYYGLPKSSGKIGFEYESTDDVFELKNIPNLETYLVVLDSEQKMSFTRILKEQNQVSISLTSIADGSLANNDFSDGATGWAARKGDLRLSVDVSPYDSSKTEPVIAFEPNIDGEIELVKSIAPMQGDDEAVFSFKAYGITKNDYYTLLLKTRQSNRVSFESLSFEEMGVDPSVIQGASSGLRDLSIKVDGVNDIVDVYFYKKTYLTSSAWFKQKIEKAFSAIFAYAQASGSGGARVRVIETRQSFFTQMQLSDSRMLDPSSAYNNYLSTGYYHPYENFSIQREGISVGVNNLVFREISISNPNLEFESISLRIYDPRTDQLIQEVPLSDSAKLLIPGSSNFRLRSNLVRQLAFQLESNTINTHAPRLILRVYGRANNTDYLRRVGELINLVSMRPSYISGDSPAEEAVYERVRFGSEALRISRDTDSGGDDFVLPDVAGRLQGLLNGSYQLGDQQVRLVFNDAARLNGGLYSRRGSSHHSGSHIDLNFIDADRINEGRISKKNYLVFRDQFDWTEDHAKLLLSLDSSNVEKIILTYRPFVPGIHNSGSETRVQRSLATKLYSTCTGNGIPGERIISTDIFRPNGGIHGNHVHIQYQRNGSNDGIVTRQVSDRPSEVAPYLVHHENELGVYKLEGTETGVTYRWFFMGDENLLAGSIPTEMYPIELLSSDRIKYDEVQKTIILGSYRSGYPIRLAVMAVTLADGQSYKPISCRMHSNVKLQLPSDFDYPGFVQAIGNFDRARYGDLRLDENGRVGALLFKPACAGGENFRHYTFSYGTAYGTGPILYKKATSRFSVPQLDLNSPLTIDGLKVYNVTRDRRALLSGNLMYGYYDHDDAYRGVYIFTLQKSNYALYGACSTLLVFHTERVQDPSSPYPVGTIISRGFGEYTDTEATEE